MDVAIPRCSTKRLITVFCPECGALIEIELEGLPTSVSADSWLATLTPLQWMGFHDEHERVRAAAALERPRVRTRRLT